MSIKNLYKIAGKTALVTGGVQGIGKAISLALAEYGVNIVVNYRSDKQNASQTKTEIEQLGVKCWTLECDLSEPNAPQKISDYLSQNKIEIDILILNASVQFKKTWDDVNLEEFDCQINTNLKASFFLIQKLYRNMQNKQWGRIVTIGSVQQIRPHQQMIIYAASKVAQTSIVKSLAPQFGKYGVTINNLAPGAFNTPRNEAALMDENYKKIVEAKIPLGFIGEPLDCAGAIILLCSDAGRYITGQDLYIDGGMGLNY